MNPTPWGEINKSCHLENKTAVRERTRRRKGEEGEEEEGCFIGESKEVSAR